MPGTVPDPVTQISEAEKVCSWTSHLVFLQINNSLRSFHRVRSAVEKESRETESAVLETSFEQCGGFRWGLE